MNNRSKVEAIAEKNREKTTEKVALAIERLKKRKKKITMNSLAKEANISRTTLYNRPDLKAMMIEANSLIDDLKSPKKPNGGSQSNRSVQEKRLTKLKEENQELKMEKQKLLEQNAGLTEMVLDLNRKIADLEERLHKTTVIKLADGRK